MSPAPTAPKTMADGVAVATRMAIALLVLGAIFGLLWLTLPVVRAAMLPAPPPGGWVLGPHHALRFGACTVLAALTAPFLLRPIGRRWRERDLAARGAPIDPLAAHPATKLKTLIQGSLLFVVYAIGGAFYFASYTEVLEDRVVIHSPLGTRELEYHRILALERHAPVGGQAERYAMRFDDESWGYFGVDHEGATEEEIARVAAHIRSRTGLSWVDARRP